MCSGEYVAKSIEMDQSRKAPQTELRMRMREMASAYEERGVLLQRSAIGGCVRGILVCKANARIECVLEKKFG